MRTFTLCLLAGLILLAGGRDTRAQNRGKRQYYEARWHYDAGKGYHYKRYYYKPRVSDAKYKVQYIIYKPKRTKQFVYWYNPEKKVYWARCATIHHPTLGKQVKAGKDLWSFLPDGKKKAGLDNIEEGDFGPVKNTSPPIPGSSDGATIDCPPPDLPPS
jgi:hypothetical protein